MSSGRWVVVMTQSERMALIDLLVEFLMEPGSTREFLDENTGKKTGTGDLLRILDQARWISEFPMAKTNNSIAIAPPNVKS